MQLFSKKKWLYPSLTFLFSLLLTSYAVYFVYQAQLKYTLAQVEKLAEQQADSLQQVVENDLHFIGAGANFFHATQPEDWQQFSLFAQQVVANSTTLVALQWMPKVEKADIAQHVRRVKQIYPSFQLYTVPKDGEKTYGYVMPDNKAIYPASDVYPHSAANFNVLGYYSSRQRFQLVLDSIRDTGRPNVSDKIRLLQDGLDPDIPKTGLLVYHPVFDADGHNELIGVVIGVIRTTKYFESIIVRTATELDLMVKVTDLGFDAEDDPILYQSDGWNSTQGIDVSKRIVLSNREWMVDFKLAQKVTADDKIVLIGIFIAGLVIASLSGYIVLLLIRDKQHLEVLLDKRTQELQFLVDHDALTGIYNRRAFGRYLADKIIRSECFALVGFDIDNFKLINDRYGHIAGDETLRHVARTVESCLQEGDVFVRMGGDEFCILSSVTDRIELQAYLEQICDAVSTRKHRFEGQMVGCSVSIGAAVRRSESAEDIMQASDAQLYKSKHLGRNQVAIAE